MPLNFFRPKPGSFGVETVSIRSGQIGPANFLGGASPLTANATTIFRLGGLGAGTYRFLGAGASALTIPADSDGTILATVQKYNAAGDAAVTLTGNIDLEALVTRKETTASPLSTLTEAQITINPGDTIEVAVVNNSAAIDTQPAGLVFTATFARLF